MSVERIALIVVGILLVIAVLAGFRALGPPGYQRRVAIDRERTQDLSVIALGVRAGNEAPAKLPAQMPHTYPYGHAGGEAVSTAPYAYRRIDAHHFELCATFLEAVPGTEQDHTYPHATGRTCYRYDMQTPGGLPTGQ